MQIYLLLYLKLYCKGIIITLLVNDMHAALPSASIEDDAWTSRYISDPHDRDITESGIEEFIVNINVGAIPYTRSDK